MSHRWAALVLVLALCAMTPRHAAGQTGSQPRGHSAKGGLGQNHPNPFNPETTIPFSVTGCVDGSEQHAVTLVIRNVLAQLVATPVFAGAQATSTANVSPSLQKQPMRNLRLPCGDYKAYWNGNDQSGKEAASGIYVVLLQIDGRHAGSIRMYNAK